MGHEVVLIDKLRPATSLWLRFKIFYYRYLRKKVYLVNRDRWIFRARRKNLERRLRDAGPFDAILFTFVPDAAYVSAEAPKILFHDTTFIQLLDYYSPRAELAAETIRSAIALDALALKTCDHAIYSSQWAAKSAIEDCGALPDRVSVAATGASLPSCPTRNDLETSLTQRGTGSMRLLFVGRNWNRKGGSIAVAVAAEIECRGIPVELYVVGCKPEGALPPFVRVVEELDKKVTDQRERLYALYRQCDFFILPTRAEAVAIAFSESAAFGLPVMTTDTGGVTQAVQHDWGLVLPLDASPAKYADWAIDNYRNRAAYNRLCNNARNQYDRELNWVRFCEHLLSVVADLRARRQSLNIGDK
jgi:glycosyltransferase involved in cell wall biosynthesis